jgi:hypothetical protein
MLKSDTTAFMDTWAIDVKYTFITMNWFNFDYVVLERLGEDEFKTYKSSTTDMGTFTKEEVEKLVGSDIFIYKPFEHWDQDFHALRSSRCDCGSNATINKDLHATWCRKYSK